jgi:glycosyltransferase involved in cell wall biosynthesis
MKTPGDTKPPTSEMKAPVIRLLFATAEPSPTFRADVAALFGKYLPRVGVLSDVVTERAPDSVGQVNWGGGEALLTAIYGGKAGKYAVKLMHCALTLLRADPTKYQAIQVRDMPVAALVGILAARWKKLPFFYWMSYPIPEAEIKLARGRGLSAGVFRFLLPWLHGRIGVFLLYRVVLPQADHIFVQSDKMREDVGAKRIPIGKMTPVPMAVDFEVAREESIMPSEDSRLAGRRVLIYLGTLDRDRQIDFLFEMLRLVRKEFPDVLLVLVGDAEDEPHRRWLQQRAEELGVADATIWTGWLPIQEGWRYVRAAEIGLSPFPRGPLLDSCSPTKSLEYLALGVPVVGNDNADQKRVLEEGGGGLCVPFAADNFAQAVCRLLANEPLRRAMACAGQNYVRARRSYALLAQTLADKYADLLSVRTETSSRQ